MQYVKRLEDKYFSPYTNKEELHFFMYPDIVFHNEYYDYSFGLYSQVIELNYILLKGSYINGILWEDTTITSVEDESLTSPEQFNLSQNFPNPFNSSSLISFYLPNSALTELSIYNILGEKIETLINEYKPAGSYEVEFQSTVLSRQMVSGVYFYQLKAGNYIETKKMILLK
jgi:hypothetical protein